VSQRRSPLAIALSGATLALLALGSTASAQTQSLFGGTGGTAGGGGGAARGGAAGGGTAAAANAQAGAFESGGPQLTTELGGASQTAGQQAFLGRGAGTALVGNAGALGGGQGGQQNVPDFSAGGGGGGRGGQANGGRGTGGQGTRSVIRPVLRIAFDFPEMAPVAVDSTLRAHVATIATQRPEFGGVRVRVDDGGTAIVSGVVATEADAKLALALARLEPGVRNVEGNLAIQAAPVP
jgi:hypothetical protein